MSTQRAFVKGSSPVSREGSVKWKGKLLKRGGGTSPFGRKNWLLRYFQLHSNVLS